MDYEFHSLGELFQRVRPALRVKSRECQRLGYFDIKDIQIWNYLMEKKWKKDVGLMLSDVVDDILHVDIGELDDYFHNQIDSEKIQPSNMDII